MSAAPVQLAVAVLCFVGAEVALGLVGDGDGVLFGYVLGGHDVCFWRLGLMARVLSSCL